MEEESEYYYKDIDPVCIITLSNGIIIKTAMLLPESPFRIDSDASEEVFVKMLINFIDNAAKAAGGKCSCYVDGGVIPLHYEGFLCPQQDIFLEKLTTPKNWTRKLQNENLSLGRIVVINGHGSKITVIPRTVGGFFSGKENSLYGVLAPLSSSS